MELIEYKKLIRALKMRDTTKYETWDNIMGTTSRMRTVEPLHTTSWMIPL